MNRRSLRFFQIILLIIGTCLIIPFIVALVYGEQSSARAFLITIVFAVSVSLSMHLVIINMAEVPPLKNRDSFFIVTVTWLLASAIGAMPFVIQGCIPSYVDAFFEMCSGFSTTGASILTNVEALPQSMLFWRSFTHWLGGMGIIVLVMAVVPIFGVNGRNIASAETPGPTLDKMTSKFSDTAKRLYIAYFIMTAIETVLLLFGGLSLFDALVQTFGTVGTGGFSNYSDSIAHFGSDYVTWIITIFMVLAGTNFNLFFVALHSGISKAFNNEELRLYLKMIVFGTIIITVVLLLKNTYSSPWAALTDSAFQVSTIVSTTGYSTANYDAWPTFCKMVLFLLMFSGASSSSTAGGIKIIRQLVLFKMLKKNLKHKIHDNLIYDIKIDGNKVVNDVVTNIVAFISLYIIVLLAGIVVVSFDGFDMLTNVTSVIACLGNIGPGFNLVGPAFNYSMFSDFNKIFLSLLMIAGRLELFTFFLLFSRHYWNSNRA